jgi:type IV secretory pathway VirB2 component (pilin)
MRNRLAFILTFCALAGSALAVASATPLQPASNAKASVDDVLKAVRADLQGGRAEIIARNIPLTAGQAAKFWPAFEQYQSDRNAITDEQLKGIQQYVERFEMLDDAGAVALIHAHFDRDTGMNAPRQKWLEQFQQVLPTKLAVRVIQIDRRLSLVHQIPFAAQIPLGQ